MYEKFWSGPTWVYAIIGFAILVGGSLLSNSCRSGPTGGSSELVIDHQRQIDKLTAELADRDRRLELYNRAVGTSVERLGSIAERSRNLENNVGEIIRLFDEYQRGVEQLIQAYYGASSEAGGSDQVLLDTGTDTDS